MTFLEAYHAFVMQTLKEVQEVNEAAIQEGAAIMAQAELAHQRIYTFGTGHSHMIGQDLYARAGGYAKFYPIDEIELTLATHPTKSTHIERCGAYADVLEHIYHIHEGDVIIVTSNSGRNPLVVEFALRCKQKGAKLIAITSLTHSKTIESRHESGLRLFEVADIVLDNKAPYGDAGIAIQEVRMGPVSTMTGCYLAQSLAGSMVELLQKAGVETPVFRSSNMDGADEYNAKLFDAYVIKKI